MAATLARASFACTRLCRVPIREGRTSLCLAKETALRRPAPSLRSASTAVTVEREGPVAILTLTRKPVNSFSQEFMHEIGGNLKSLESDPSCRGVIIASGLPKVYSAGLDLVKELYNQVDKDKLANFWGTFQDMWLLLYGSRLITMAAVTGHALAGGCVMALSCDYRVMASDSSIAMVETMAGVPVPPWVFSLTERVAGTNEAEQMCFTSQMYPAEKALKVGLAHKVTDKEHVLAETKQEMAKWLKIPDRARVLTKQTMRQEALDKLRQTIEQDKRAFADCLADDEVQRAIGEQIQRMSKAKK